MSRPINRFGPHHVLVYDDENQLTRYFHGQNNFANITAGDRRTDFVYDGLGRLRKRIEWVVSCNQGTKRHTECLLIGYRGNNRRSRKCQTYYATTAMMALLLLGFGPSHG